MAENKFGLHKEVSAIFDGIPIPSRVATPVSRYVEPVNVLNKEPEIAAAPVQKPIQPAKSNEFSNFGNLASGQFKQFQNKINSFFGLNINNKRQISMIGLTALLSLILVVVLFRGTGSTKKNYIHKSTGQAKASIVPQVNWQPPAEYLSNMRDPMQVGSGKSSKNETGDVIVKGIVFSEDSPSVIIDGLILNEGDKISGVTVLKINSDGVELKKDGKVWTQQVE